MESASLFRQHRTTSVASLLWALLVIAATSFRETTTVSIKPADFDRYIMPCYLGSSSSQYNGNGNGNGQYSQQQQQPPLPAYYGDQSPPAPSMMSYGTSNMSGAALAGASLMPSANRQRELDRFTHLGQQIPRANTVDNFVALVSKIEAANPRLAQQPDQLIRMLLSRFRMDNYYYDVRNRVPISGEQDPRTRDIIPALLAPGNPNAAVYGMAGASGGESMFPEHLLEHDEKCSMYFMLSHFIDKTQPLNQPLGASQPSQLTGSNSLLDRVPPFRPPSLQAAGSGYPSLSANSAGFGSGNGGGGGGSLSGSGSGSGSQPARYPGPSAGFGSPATNGMYSFGTGLSNQPDYTGPNQLGQNVLRENSLYQQQQAQQLSSNNYNSPMRNSGPYSGAQQQQRYGISGSTPYLDGQARLRDERQAIEYGVVTVGSQENAALVLNRVLMGILAATTPPQSIRQLAGTMYAPTTQQGLTQTPKIDEEIDPLYALTLADLWAVSSIPKSGKVFDFKLGDNGHWNDTMCPTSFVLERASSIRFTTAELIGGLDGFALGMFRRRMIGMRKNIRLSDLLRMYYSRAGFRPQFAEVSVCNRASALSTQMDELRRQTENYLRLYQLNLPVTDDQISSAIARLDSFRDLVRQVTQQFVPQEICSDSSLEGSLDSQYARPIGGGTGGLEQCEIAKADVVTVLDTSMQANEMFMNMVVQRLAQKLGLSRQGNTFSILTNQQDTTGYAGAYSFNAIVRNSSNTAEIGCALVHDATRSYQGGQINDPTRLMEMFERALINLDSEYLMRQMNGGGQMGAGGSQAYSYASTSRQSSYVSSLFAGGAGQAELAGGPKNTGGAKVIVWFNYGTLPRMASLSSGQTNWYPNNGPGSGYSSEQNQYKLHEAKKYLRENFRGASILAVANSKEDVKSFVFDEDRDIFTDIPQGSSASGSDSSTYGYGSQQWDPTAVASLSGPADQLVSRLVQRMCDIPALFQYPMCFRVPSENVASVGYISPGKKQYWMMSPKTFFASRTVRMAFRVEGGRLRVCFGRMAKPDESASRTDSQFSQSGGISFGNPAAGASASNQITSGASSSSSSNNYYTGLSNGICKDVSPGQEIDFVVDDPCYKKSIAECEPFYFVIREISNPGEGDPNYMCKDEGCRRFDQVKFVMTHTGVICSSAFRTLASSWLLLIVSTLTALSISNETRSLFRSSSAKLAAAFGLVLYVSLQQVHAQQAGVYDFGQGRYGEKRGNFTPSEVLAIILLVMTILAGLALTIGLCYYVTKRNSRGMTRVEQNDY